MSQTKTQAEPTMEEILASIRRIISEDEPESGGRREDSAGPAAEVSAPEPEPEADDDVLELTQKVGEDGTVIDLAAERMALAAQPEPAWEAASEPELAASEPEPEPEFAAAEPEPEAEPGFEPEPEPLFEPKAAAPAPDEDSLLTPATESAAVGTLSQLMRAASEGRRARSHSIGDGRTLEEIVRAALVPELKAWLDDNLAPLVEQIVREEIKKMVRRAEES